MAGFRLRWAANLVCSPAIFRRLKEELCSPLRFCAAMALKLIPGLYPAPIKLNLHDGKFFYVNTFMTLYIFVEIFVERIYDLPDACGTVETIIDVGANTGLFVVRAKQVWPDATIVAFEPEPRNYAELEKTIKDNGFSGVIARNEAISAECGAATLFLHPRNVGGHSMYHRHSNKTVIVEARTIAGVLGEMRSEAHCDLLKIDCEGCERDILRSLTADTASRIRTIVYEPEGRLYSVPEMNQWLESLGYVARPHGLLVLAQQSSS